MIIIYNKFCKEPFVSFLGILITDRTRGQKHTPRDENMSSVIFIFWAKETKVFVK